MAMIDWTTLPPEFTRPGEAGRLHQVWFWPNGWPGTGKTICLLLPECHLYSRMIDADGKPVTIVNKPESNKDVAYWIRSSCKQAMAGGAAIVFGCDTAEQAEQAAEQAAKWLSGYQRVPIERVYGGLH
jgi:hypothetical protein